MSTAGGPTPATPSQRAEQELREHFAREDAALEQDGNRVLVCGSRVWKDRVRLYAMLSRLHAMLPITTLVHGAQGTDKEGRSTWGSDRRTVSGADMMAHEWAVENNVRTEGYPANWKRDGKAAGPIRNTIMANARLNRAIAFAVNLHSSTGTRDMVNRLSRKGVHTIIVNATPQQNLAGWRRSEHLERQRAALVAQGLHRPGAANAPTGVSNTPASVEQAQEVVDAAQ